MASLYVSALFYGAARALARLQGVAGETGRADLGARRRTRFTPRSTASFGTKRGASSACTPSFRAPVHTRPMPTCSPWAETPWALLYALGDEARTARILAAAEQRHERYGLGTLAGSASSVSQGILQASDPDRRVDLPERRASGTGSRAAFSSVCSSGANRKRRHAISSSSRGGWKPAGASTSGSTARDGARQPALRG